MLFLVEVGQPGGGDTTGPDAAFSSASDLTWSNVFSAFDVARRTVRFARRNPPLKKLSFLPGPSLSAEEDKRFFCRANQLEKPCATLRLTMARKRQGPIDSLEKKDTARKKKKEREASSNDSSPRTFRARFKSAKVPRRCARDDDVDVKLATDVDVNFKF